MSDGHFNKAILPHNDYCSGLKVGRAMQKRQCEDALRQALLETDGISPEQQATILQNWQKSLRSKGI